MLKPGLSEVPTSPGDTLEEVYKTTRIKAINENRIVQFCFCGIDVQVDFNSQFDCIELGYRLAAYYKIKVPGYQCVGPKGTHPDKLTDVQRFQVGDSKKDEFKSLILFVIPEPAAAAA